MLPFLSFHRYVLKGRDQVSVEIEVDLHVHTLASGHGYSTVTELARAAVERGLKGIAITEHGPAMPGGPHPYFFGNIRTIPDEIYGIRIIKGIEANVIDLQGTLDIEDEYAQRLDFLAVSLHRDTGYTGRTRSDHTQALINAAARPGVGMIVHPCLTRYPVDPDALAGAAAELDVILEVNNRSFDARTGFREDRKACLRMLHLARKLGVMVALNSDAHFWTEVGDVKNAIEIASAAGLTPDQIINADLDRFLRFLRDKDQRGQTGGTGT